MTENHRCNRCGDLLPSDAPEGTCPACMPRTDLEPDAQPTGVSAGGQATCDFELAQTGHVLERLARSIGTVPRVRLPDTAPDDTGVAVTKPSSDAMPAPAERGGRYQLFGEIARGGMGAVLRGRDPDLGRDLAVKVLLESHEDRPEMLRRFVEEAQIGGQLQHPGIVPVYELGTFADRRPYFTMKLVRGRTLSSLLAERLSPAHDLPRSLSIFEAICQTVAYSHARGVIHRDLKPSNVMVGSFGEVQVMDWGLAKVLKEGGVADESPVQPAAEESVVATVRSGSNRDESQAGSVLGTPAYMAPEQAAGDIGRVDRRSDVFGLGSILCEVLTGQPAYTGRGALETLRKARRGETADALARLDGCGAEAELIALAKDCLAVEPEDRPRDANAVAERITAYMAGVQARVQAAERERAVAVARAIEERRRRKVQLALAASVLALTTLGGLSTTYYLQQRAAQAAAGQRVIDQVTTLQGQALAHPEEIQRWEIALAAVERADPARDSNTNARLLALQEQITAGLVAAQRDKMLLDRLVDIRSAESDDPEGSATDAAYADAFREAGIDLASLTPAEAGSKIRARPPSVALALAGALDDWASQRRRARPNDKESWRRLSDAARVADPDPWRNELRTALDQSDKAARLTALQALAKTAKFELLGAISLHLLGTGLNDAGDRARAESVLRTAQDRHPSDVWANYALGTVLEKLSRRDEAIRFYTAARAIRPETAHELAHALAKRGDSEESIAVFRDLKGLRPGNIKHLSCLGTALKAKGHSREANETLEAAVAVGRRAIELRPNDELAHFELGLALAEQGNPHEADAEWRTAIRLRPGHLEAHSNLATSLSRQGKLDEAMDEWRKAIRLNPENAGAHSGIGDVLRDQGKFDEAIAAYREAMRLKPDYLEPHHNLGLILSDQGKLDEAVAELRTAIRLQPNLAEPHYNLGLDLARQDKLNEAMAEWRVVIQLDPGYAEAYCNLGTALQQRGAYAEALEMYRRGHELGSRRPDWGYPSAQWLAAAERQMALSKRFPAMLRGEDPPKDNAERVALAQHASGRARFALATRLLAQALESDPKLGDDREAELRYAAASDAILVADGQDKDEPPLDDAAKARLRRQALEWLRAELSAWGKMIETGQPNAGAVVSVRLENWRENDALAGVRFADRLAKFSPDEQKAWRSLWADVDSLLRRAATLDATEKGLSAIQSRARALESSKPGEAEPLLREAMELTRKQFGTADPRTAGAMAQLGNSLIQQGKWSAAEPVLRECLAIREKNQPEEWTTFNTRSVLGGSLLGQKKYAEAEPLIVSGYEGMKAREAKIPPPGKPRFTDAAERVVKLYEAWGKPEKAAEWRARLAKPSDEANKPHP